MEISGKLNALATAPPAPTEKDSGWALQPIQMLWKRLQSLATGRNCTACSLLVCIIPTELPWLLIMLRDEYILWKPVVPNLLCSSNIFSSQNASKCCALCKTVCLNHNELAPPRSLKKKNLPILQTAECPSNSRDINRQHFVLCCCILKRNNFD